MLVKDLIRKLQEHDPELDVKISDIDGDNVLDIEDDLQISDDNTSLYLIAVE